MRITFNTDDPIIKKANKKYKNEIGKYWGYSNLSLGVFILIGFISNIIFIFYKKPDSQIIEIIQLMIFIIYFITSIFFLCLYQIAAGYFAYKINDKLWAIIILISGLLSTFSFIYNIIIAPLNLYFMLVLLLPTIIYKLHKGSKLKNEKD